jgi:hypothetical protein
MRENYIDKGVEFDDALQSTAKDLSMHPDEVRREIITRQTKPLTDQMYLQMARRRQSRSAAQQWVRNADKSVGERALDAVSNTLFNIKVMAGIHGTVGPGTHAGENIYHPTRWADYFTNVGRTWKAVASPGAHERYMRDLVNDPNYVVARRAGLANEPNTMYDDYQNNQLKKILGDRLGNAGNRGFDVLKRMRQDFFNSRWEKLSPEQQTPEFAKEIADMVNHSTGAIRTRLPGKIPKLVAFAPQLEGSRIARIIGDPIKATNTFLNWNKSTQAQKYFAKAVVKNAAGFMATYLASLAANQAINKMSGSKDEINFTDPSKADWLRHKVHGYSIESTGGLVSTMRLLARLVSPALNPVRARAGMQPVKDTVKDALYSYGRGKLSPVAAPLEDVRSGVTYGGNPVPWSNQAKGEKGQPRLSWSQYLSTEQTPIPVSEGLRTFYEEMQKQGIPTNTINNILDAAAKHPDALGKSAGVGAVGGTTGLRVSPEFSPKPAKTSPIARTRSQNRTR